LLRALLLVGDNSPEVCRARLRMCGVDVDRRSSPGILLLEERLFLLECWWPRVVVSGLVKLFLNSRCSVGLGMDVGSGAGPSAPGLWFEGFKDITLRTGCRGDSWSSLQAVFFARRSVPTAMCSAVMSQYPRVKARNQTVH
jgi:hypothetical protein